MKNGNRIDWFWAKVEKTDGCWHWRGHTAANGYGRFLTDQGSKAAHRVAYEALVGPIPKGLEIDHLCRDRACVNPAHMEPVTHAENCARSVAATKTHCVRGHPLSGDNLFRTSRGHRECRTCRRNRHREYMREYNRKKRECA